ncbi:AAEL010490-PB [Aedes aegypti]|uniref:AAEL010490-PA n=1 Tax=Aedes aegypti TaxID=7159 RepID=Q16ST3_AEDAE|nr:AAEL010490-PA [Aedes aegypti]EJY57874.1 AAEL010490-PB [Aedes aegypti]
MTEPQTPGELNRQLHSLLGYVKGEHRFDAAQTEFSATDDRDRSFRKAIGEWLATVASSGIGTEVLVKAPAE